MKSIKNITDIPNGDIVYFGQRIEPYFASSIVAGGICDAGNLRRRFNLDDPVGWFVHVSDHDKHNYDFFNIKSDLDRFLPAVRQKIEHENIEYVNAILNDCLSSGKKLVSLAARLHRENQGQITNDNLVAIIERFTREARDYCIFYTIAFFDKPELDLVAALINKYSNSKNDAENIFKAVATANQSTDSDLEQEAFLKLAAAKFVNEQTRGDAIRKHAKIYGWLGIRFFIGDWWEEEDVLARLRQLPRREAIILLKERENANALRERSIEEFKSRINEKEKHIIDQARKMVFLRTQRADLFHHASALVKPFVELAAQRLGLTYHDLLYFSPDEVTSALEGEYALQTELEARQTDMLVYFGEGLVLVLSGQAASDYTMLRNVLDRSEVFTNLLQGVTAFKGKVRGKARIVLTSDDGRRVNKGDILVSIMTTPDLIAAMERAGAFVTDEGGILCHAAIMAREMKKPCIIATKIATRIIKDNDLVEVDAERGIVKIIKRGYNGVK